MEAASDSLFGQLNNVRTPRQSPTHMSRSPSPPLFDDAAPPQDTDVAFSAAFGQTVEELSDHEDARAASPAQPAEIDLWDSAPVAKAKTNDQILSLFNAPSTQQRQEVDLLSSSFHDEAPPPPPENLLDGPLPPTPVVTILEGSPIKSSVQAQSEDAPQPAAPAATVPDAEEKQEEDEGAAQLAPPPPPAAKPSSPSEEVALRPLELELDTPVVTLTESTVEPPEDPSKAHTAAAFMEEFCSPVVPASHITPPSPMSPIGPSPLPSVTTTPILAEGPPPGQYQPSVPAEEAAPPPPPPPPAPEPVQKPPPPSPNPFLDTAEAEAGAAPEDAFDAFAARFEKAADETVAADPFDPFAGAAGATESKASAWGSSEGATAAASGQMGFEDSAFDSFLSMTAPPPVPQSTPARAASKQHSEDEQTDLNVVIRPQQDWVSQSQVPTLAPPPRPAVAAFQDNASINPFASAAMDLNLELAQAKVERPGPGPEPEPEAGSGPATPLFDDDISQPLEPFPRTVWETAEFDMFLRQPNKKKITGQRFWKKIFVRLADNAVLQLFHDRKDADPFQELPLQACYSVSDVGAQQYDQYGKIFTVKLQYIFYKERPGVRPGQMTKAERITKKIGQFAISAWEGDYDRVKEFASDVRKLGMPVEHAPQISQLLKLGTQQYEDVKRFASYVEETLFHVNVHRDRALSYKTEEVQITGVDEVYLEQDVTGAVTRQLARVRLFFLAFLSGMPDVELGINDLRRQGKEVVGRHDIIPVATEEWIRLEDVEFHNAIDLQAFKESQILKFKPPDGCYIELMRFRVRPPKSRELPLQAKIKYTILQNKVEITGDILVPGYISRKMGQIPCEDVSVRVPLPECWIYMFRVEKHFRYGSVKASHRRQGKVKGIERFLGAVDTLEQSMMEVSSGSAKYEHHHRAIVWRIPRLPKEGQGAYTNHTFSCKLNLTSFDQMPETFDKFCWVEYTMPHTTASHTVCRSASISGGSGDPPEKYVRYLARYEYKVEMEFSYSREEPAAYVSATQTSTAKPAAEPPPPPKPPSSDSDSDSD
ncbi:protein stoned-B-like [Pollicipes pollicipes]|uniref:protein stoned-B-like n=1 Tax=Pollicipes pollicipes TaxID=41117 RepID=UPI001884935E|nr:protein stoned-B-like [Pollicipes pollicipes]